ncbi:MAG TPA: ABC transporter substrate-binding protein [Anaeromyxobacteraceae bacterium]|nr:ABC transporter substrate-binding protein [Anaeromyxobacteraceae bacterium]
MTSIRLLLVLGSVPFFALSVRAGEPDRVRIQLDWVPEPEFGGIYAAQARGEFRKENLEVEVLKGSAGVATPQLVANGQVEFGIVAAEQLLAVRERGGALVAVYAVFQKNPLSLMVHAENPAHTLEEVWRGKGPVAVEPGQAFVRFLSTRYGGTPRLVPYQGALATFEADPTLAQQCYASAEPVELERRGQKVKVFPVADSGFDPYNGVVAVNGRYLAEHGDLVHRFVLALRRGWQAYLAEPTAFDPGIAALNPAMSREAMDLAAVKQQPFIESDFTRRHGLGTMDPKRWAELGRQLKDLGALKDEPDAAKVFTNP